MTKTREQRISNGTLVPNSFQHPNLYVDWLHFYLTPEEIVVLDKAIREILGWEDKIAARKAHIAHSVFLNGKTRRETGDQLCLGCGLGIHALRKALAALNEYHILVKVGKPTQDGQCYRLVDDADKIDWAGLAARREEWDRQNQKRTARATRASLQARGLTSDVGGNVARYPNPLGGNVGRTPSPASDVRGKEAQGVTSDADKETQIEEIYDLSEYKILWQAILDDLALRMEKATFDTWLRGARLVACNNGTWTVQVRHANAVDWLEHRMRATIDRTTEHHAPGVQVAFVAQGKDHEE